MFTQEGFLGQCSLSGEDAQRRSPLPAKFIVSGWPTIRELSKTDDGCPAHLPIVGFSNDPLNDSRKLSNVYRSKAIAFAAGILLSLSSGVLWLIYMANGIAYGSIVGLPGRERDLKKIFQFRAEAALITAALIQTIGVSLIAWMFVTRLPAIAGSIVLRRTLPIAVGLLSSALVFMAVRGF